MYICESYTHSAAVSRRDVDQAEDFVTAPVTPMDVKPNALGQAIVSNPFYISSKTNISRRRWLRNPCLPPHRPTANSSCSLLSTMTARFVPITLDDNFWMRQSIIIPSLISFCGRAGSRRGWWSHCLACLRSALQQRPHHMAHISGATTGLPWVCQVPRLR